MAFVRKASLRLALVLGCCLPYVGCSRSDNAELVKAKAETEAVRAEAAAAQTELAKAKAEAAPPNRPQGRKPAAESTIGRYQYIPGVITRSNEVSRG
jgi:hypothetical protein